MADANSLTLAFLRAHPGDAAQVLEAAGPDARAELFLKIPARIGSDVLAQLLPRSAAQTLSALPDERAADLLARMGVQRSVAMLQHVDEPRRARLVAELPAASALAAKLLLGYSDDEVGSRMDPAVLALGPATSVGDALQRVAGADSPVVRVFVVDDAGCLLGSLTLDELLRAPGAAALEALKPQAGPVLAARTPLAGAREHPGWQQTSTMPIVDRGGRLVGVLTRDALERATHEVRGADPARPPDGSLAEAATLGYWHGLSGILRVLLTLLPRIEPAGRRHGG